MEQQTSKGWVKTCPNCRGKVEELSRFCPACSYNWDYPVITIKRPRNTFALLCKYYCLTIMVVLPIALLGALPMFKDSVLLLLLTPFYWVLWPLVMSSPIIFLAGLVGLFKSKELSEKVFSLLAVVICVTAVTAAWLFATAMGKMR